ncbi:hypothetical protein HY837_00600 [archaeon]|nr:hypothetical protein [archaeon]
MNVSLIEKKVLRLGVSHRNIHRYERAKASVLSVPVNSSLIRRSELIKKYPELDKHNSTYLTPRIIGQALESKETVEGIYYNGRTLVLPEEKVTLNLKELGWSDKEVFQDFVLETKGSGIKLRRAESINASDVLNFLNNHKLQVPSDLSNELVFSRNQYIGFDIPEGAHHIYGANHSLSAGRYFSDAGFKIAPSLCLIKYPKKTQHVIGELDKESIFLEDLLAQEKRLMPSFVRAAYFEWEENKPAELLKLISSDTSVLKNLPEIFLDDIMKYFEYLALSTQKRKRTYYSDYLANIDRVFDNPEMMFGKDHSWFLNKDMVLAQTGLYFVDLEGSLVDHEAKSLKEMKRQHELYLLLLFKDFSRLLTQYNITLQDKRNPVLVEEETRHQFIDKLNKSEFYEVKEKDSSIDLLVKYQEIKPEKYSLDKKNLPTVN